jgi:hypothetical protein
MTDMKERLAQRRAQEHAQTVEAEMAARSSAIAEVGQKLGMPIDFSQGIPMGPPQPKTGTVKEPVRQRIVIPKPPEVTRAEEEELSKQEAEAERVQYENDMRAAGIPVGPPPNPADFQSKKTKREAVVGRKKPPHPLLTQLRHEFGIGSDQKPPVDVKVADHVWTFVPLTPDLVSLAARAADSLAETIGEHSLRAKQAAVCFSIVAVDSVPVWLMLGLEPTDHDNVSFPLIPKGPIRQNAAVMLFGELTSGMKNRLMDALYEAYMAKVDPEGSVASYTSYEKTDHVVWVCVEPDCEHKFSKPRHYEGDQELPYYCQIHGSVMIDVSTTKPRIDEDLRPLV